MKLFWVGAFEIHNSRIFLTCTIHAFSTSLIQVQGSNKLFSKQRKQSQQLNTPTYCTFTCTPLPTVPLHVHPYLLYLYMYTPTYCTFTCTPLLTVSIRTYSTVHVWQSVLRMIFIRPLSPLLLSHCHSLPHLV